MKSKRAQKRIWFWDFRTGCFHHISKAEISRLKWIKSHVKFDEVENNINNDVIRKVKNNILEKVNKIKQKVKKKFLEDVTKMGNVIRDEFEISIKMNTNDIDLNTWVRKGFQKNDSGIFH